ncbi:hypothetical protein FFT09_05640 [Saccharomonospora piscinae]|uniref:DUF6461 domain-containing protein n=1 Tax=Saccharomonospora piscinae TaxID=687388 RepID=UPI0011067034|nr:hypothetical protein [Saccharomonospora piscinae]TLW92933.1 hypothetical protein FFT09_05640 [Saccharomonospora piscinae]
MVIEPVDGTEQQRADSLIASYRWASGWSDFQLEVAVVAGIGEDDAIRRLGAEPAACPRVRSPYAAVRYALGDEDPLYEHDEWVLGPERADAYLGACDGGVAVLGPTASEGRACRNLSSGTRLASVFFNPKGSLYASCWRDATLLYRTEPGTPPPHERPEERLHHFGDPEHSSPDEAKVLALLTHHTGVSITQRWLTHGRVRAVTLPGD